MSKIKNGGLDQYGVEPFKQQRFGPAGVEGVNRACGYFLFRNDGGTYATESNIHSVKMMHFLTPCKIQATDQSNFAMNLSTSVPIDLKYVIYFWTKAAPPVRIV